MACGPLHDPRLTAMGLLIEVYEGVAAKVGAIHAAQGLSGNDFDILIRLARSPGRSLRMIDLATQTGLSTSGVTRVVDRLERQGLVCRSACQTDRRSSLALLTDEGLEKLTGYLPTLLEEIERSFTGRLEPAQLDALQDALRTVRRHVRPGATGGATTDRQI